MCAHRHDWRDVCMILRCLCRLVRHGLFGFSWRFRECRKTLRHADTFEILYLPLSIAILHCVFILTGIQRMVEIARHHFCPLCGLANDSINVKHNILIARPRYSEARKICARWHRQQRELHILEKLHKNLGRSVATPGAFTNLVINIVVILGKVERQVAGIELVEFATLATRAIVQKQMSQHNLGDLIFRAFGRMFDTSAGN